MEETLLWLFTGSRGGKNRVRIVNLLRKKPFNVNRISEELNLNYNTISHHLKLLQEHKVIYSNKNVKYGALYFISDSMKAHYEILDKILENLGIEE